MFSSPKQEWPYRVILGALLFGVVMTISPLVLPAFAGCPIHDPKVQLLWEPGLRSDTRVDAAKDTLICIERDFAFRHTELPSGRDDPQALLPNVTNILVRIDHSRSAGHSSAEKRDPRRRRTFLDPSHSGFDSKTLAHEFGHQKFGDVCLPDPEPMLGLYLNVIFDIRINSIIDYRDWRSQCAGSRSSVTVVRQTIQ
jgi:hypothetical protein